MKSSTLFRILVCLFLCSSILYMGESFGQAKKKTTKRVKKPAPTQNGGSTAPDPAAAAAEPADKPGRRVTADSIDYDPKTGYNTLSIFPIHVSDIMRRTRVWRRIDVNEKCNTPFYNTDAQITKFIIEAWEKGEITAFTNDSLVQEKTKKEVTNSKQDLDPADANNNRYYGPKQMTIIEIKEDLIFDRQRSQTRFDILALTLIIPGTETIRQIDQTVASFRYKDIERVLDARPEARWRNGYNNSEDRRYSDAFRLRLFCSRIFKIAMDNPSNDDISGMPAFKGKGDRTELLAAQQYEYDLVSQENELYEY